MIPAPAMRLIFCNARADMVVTHFPAPIVGSVGAPVWIYAMRSVIRAQPKTRGRRWRFE
jgi:hypothetical protein